MMITKISMSPFTQILLRIFIVNPDVDFLIQRHEREFRINLHFYTCDLHGDNTCNVCMYVYVHT